MSKKLFSQILAETSDNLSLPERIIQAIELDRETKADFLQVITSDGERLYSIRDWVFYISGSKNKQRFAPWKDLKRSLLEAANSSEGVETFEVSEFLTALDVETAGGKQEMEFTTEEGLYQITQRMSDRSKAVRDIKTFLAQSGVFMGEAYTNPEGAAGQLERLAYNREYRKLLEEGFSAEEAQQCLMYAVNKNVNAVLLQRYGVNVELANRMIMPN